MFHREISHAVSDALEEFKPHQKLSILDLGCGDASMILPMLNPSRVNNYVGCDLSQPALDIAHQALETNEITHQLICDDMLRVATEQKDASLDLVFSSYALHHLNAPRKEEIIEEIARILVPGGRFVLVDVFREPTEDRAQYMRHYMCKLKDSWSKLDTESQTLVINHATEYDFPEHLTFYQNLCNAKGLNSGKVLAEHTWHKASIFERYAIAPLDSTLTSAERRSF